MQSDNPSLICDTPKPLAMVSGCFDLQEAREDAVVHELGRASETNIVLVIGGDVVHDKVRASDKAGEVETAVQE